MPLEHPQLRISIAGVFVPGIVSLELSSVAYAAADRFHLVFALNASIFMNQEYFAKLGSQVIVIEAALDNYGFANLLTGQIDNIRIDFCGNTATLTGRDLSARLIDAVLSETFSNQTASQIAMTVAARHQLTPNVVATKTPVGQYYELEHVRSGLVANSHTSTEWNLLVALAQAEGFVLSVVDTALNFGPVQTSFPIGLNPTNFISLSIDIATTLPTGATVKSWNSRDKTVISATNGTEAGTTIIRPNLTASRAQTIAANHLTILGLHNTVLSGTMPADLTLSPGALLVLSGTNSSLDQNYTVEAVSRTLRAHSGFTQNIRAYATV